MTETKWKKCSKCGGEIRLCNFLGTELESCQNCNGFFLNPKHIQNAAALAQSDADVKKRLDQSFLDSTTMLCPKCQSSMAKAAHKRKGTIVLDVCPSCHGIWFDAGEYAKYCGLPTKKWPKEEMYKVRLFCEACNSVLRKPEKEQNVCSRCGNRLSLSLQTAFNPGPPFWHDNHFYAVILFITGLGIIYFIALKTLGSVFQASVLSFALCPIPLIYIVRALIYSKVFMSDGPRASGRDFDI